MCEESMSQYYINQELLEGVHEGSEEIWTTKDGRKIPISRMDNQHLINTIKMLIRKAQLILDKECYKYINGPRPRGEMAQEAFEIEFNNLLKITPIVFLREKCPQWQNLVDEAHRRNLEWQ